MRGLALFLVASSCWGGAPDRRQQAIHAAREFSESHLFTSGRGIHLPAGLISYYERAQSTRLRPHLIGVGGFLTGVNLEDRSPVGLLEARYQDLRVGVLGCVVCHSGRAAGRLVIGLGNKRIDTAATGRLTEWLSLPYLWTISFRPDPERRLIEQTMAFARVLQNPRWANVTEGQVPFGVIQRWFYEQAGRPMPLGMPAAGVKAPHLWGYGEKRKAGLFCDGLGDGAEPGWAAMVELAAGQMPETVRSYRSRLDHVEELIEKLLPPVYPFAIDAELAWRGQAVYQRECSRCHGGYHKDLQGLPVFQAPRWIDWNLVQTDPYRLESLTPEFRSLVASNTLSDLIRGRAMPPGYFAPRLEGVWSRFPYLHNASTPSLRALLTPPDRRPYVFSLLDAGERHRFDPVTVGLTIPEPDGVEHFGLRRLAAWGARHVFDVRRPGHSNRGHAFGLDLTETQRTNLIEYLKTL